MKSWEYKLIAATSTEEEWGEDKQGKEFVTRLNQAGQEGWRVIYCFHDPYISVLMERKKE